MYFFNYKIGPWEEISLSIGEVEAVNKTRSSKGFTIYETKVKTILFIIGDPLSGVDSNYINCYYQWQFSESINTAIKNAVISIFWGVGFNQLAKITKHPFITDSSR